MNTESESVASIFITRLSLASRWTPVALTKKSFAFPEIVHAGLYVTKLGNSSVRYEIGLFSEGDDEPSDRILRACVCGSCRGKSVAIPAAVRAALRAIHVAVK